MGIRDYMWGKFEKFVDKTSSKNSHSGERDKGFPYIRYPLAFTLCVATLTGVWYGIDKGIYGIANGIYGNNGKTELVEPRNDAGKTNNLEILANDQNIHNVANSEKSP